jgi:hypothetical protein
METFWQSFVDNFIKGIPNLLTALAIFILSLYDCRGHNQRPAALL